MDLKGKEIIILFDYLEKFEQPDIDHINKQLNLYKSKIEEKRFVTHLVSVKDSIQDALKDFDPSKVVVFNWCEQFSDIPKSYHLIPAALEKMGFYYTGCDSACLELTQDKIATKEVLLKNKVSTPFSKVYKRGGKFLNGWHRFPSIVKPQLEHSSEGISKESIVDNTEQLIERVNFVIKNYKGGALVEEYINGPEYLVSVWGNEGHIEALPLVQLDYSAIDDYHNKIYSYDAKFNEKAVEYHSIKAVLVLDMDKDLEEKIKKVAIDAYIKTGCSGYARIDTRVSADGIPYVLDVNANPDVSVIGSEFLMSASGVGFDYGDTVLKLCELALKREMNVSVESDTKLAIAAN